MLLDCYIRQESRSSYYNNNNNNNNKNLYSYSKYTYLIIPIILQCPMESNKGEVLSAILFTLYPDKLLVRLKNSNIGCSINGCYTGALSFADDIT